MGKVIITVEQDNGMSLSLERPTTDQLPHTVIDTVRNMGNEVIRLLRATLPPEVERR